MRVVLTLFGLRTVVGSSSVPCVAANCGAWPLITWTAQDAARRASWVPATVDSFRPRAWFAPAARRRALVHGEMAPKRAAPRRAAATLVVKVSTVGTSFSCALPYGHDA